MRAYGFIYLFSCLALLSAATQTSTLETPTSISEANELSDIPSNTNDQHSSQQKTTIIAGASAGVIGIAGAGTWLALKSLRKDKSIAGGEENSFEQVDKEKMMEIDIDEFLR